MTQEEIQLFRQLIEKVNRLERQVALLGTQEMALGATLTGGGTLATGGFTLTVPASGTASLLGTAQTYSALKTFSAGISFGNETLSIYDEGTWTPVVSDGTNSATIGTSNAWYTRAGKIMVAGCRLINITTAGMTAGNSVLITGLPVAATSQTNYRAQGIANVSDVTFSNYVIAQIAFGSTNIALMEFTSAGVAANLTVSDLTSGAADILFTITYLTD